MPSKLLSCIGFLYKVVQTRKSSLRTVLNPQLWPWGERLQHEKQTDLFRNLKFHDWLVSFVWWSAVTNQSWNFKLRNKSVCFSCCTKLYIKLAFSLCSFSQFSFPFNFRTAEALVLKFGPLPLYHLFSNTLLAIFDTLFVQELFTVLYQKMGQTWHAGVFFNITLF